MIEKNGKAMKKTNDGFNGKTEFNSFRKCHSLFQLKLLELACARFVWKGRNTYSFNRCFMILEGEGELENHTGKQVIAMLPGNVCFMPPGLDLSFDFKPGLKLLSIHFQAFILPGVDVFSGVTDCAVFPVAKERLDKLEELMDHEIQWNSFCLFESMLWELLYQIRLKNTVIFDNIIRLQGKYGALLAYIHSNISARMDIEELCRFSGLGRDTLSRHFSRDFGIPLKTFLMKELLAAAERHLLRNEYSIREISAKLDFSSEFYFSSFFKRMRGISPSGFRAMREKLS